MMRLHSITDSRGAAARRRGRPRPCRARGRRSRRRSRAEPGAPRPRDRPRKQCRPRRSRESLTASASSALASRFGPASMPSRAMSVCTSAATPASSKRFAHLEHGRLAGCEPALHGDAAVFRVEPDRDPAREAARGAAHELGVAQRRGAEHDAVDARPNAASTAARSRRPPPSWTGSRADRRDDRAHGGAVCGRPARAPSRSTTCSRGTACAANRRATAAGSAS